MDLVSGPSPELEVDGASRWVYFQSLRLRLQEVHKLVRQSLHEAGVPQRRACDIRCREEDFSTGVGVRC